ncbi:hypothetical protein EVAR_79801_1 [Eumeta japonica]|uniref:Mos1 transposase HTH domain-containing protein n=1 Tax=Eumeta variegata TaxID=151549 RepID=A0A4C1WTW7_EUMVA|nr:hypothetical protein EVAR_79801_1 [Eumeta japonica]
MRPLKSPPPPAAGTDDARATQLSLGRLRTTFGDEQLCKTTICNWFAEFKRCRFNLSDEFRDNRPSTAVNNKNIDAVRRMIETVRHVTTMKFGILRHRHESNTINVTQTFDDKKLCSRWIPHSLAESQKWSASLRNGMLTRFKEGWDIVTGDEHEFIATSPKQSSNQL